VANKKLDYNAVGEIARSLPGIVDSSTARGFALKCAGKLVACQAIHKSAEPGSLMMQVGYDKREELIGMEPDIYYLTEHYVKTPAVLVRLEKIDSTALRSLLLHACALATAGKRAGTGKKRSRPTS
jgi:hypothetical protein